MNTEMKNATEVFSGENQQKRVNKLIDDMTLFDDDLMSHVFDKNIEATELILRIILGKEIKVIRVDGQDELKNPLVDGRNITLDVHAVDSRGKEIDIEVQGDAKGAVVKRARFHSSMVDVRMLKASQNFKQLRDSYVIFIYKKDKFKKGLPIYHIDRYVRETGKIFEDGSHIIYVNGSYRGDDEIAHLIEEGREIMCESVKEFAKEYADERDVIKVEKLMENLQLILEQALNALDIHGASRAYIIKQIQK